MYIKNKLGIYVYPNGISFINNIGFEVNSISYNGGCYYKNKFRIINDTNFGIELFIKKKI